MRFLKWQTLLLLLCFADSTSALARHVTRSGGHTGSSLAQTGISSESAAREKAVRYVGAGSARRTQTCRKASELLCLLGCATSKSGGQSRLLRAESGILESLSVAESRLSQTEEKPVKKQRVLAERFHFTPGTIRVEPGTRLEIELRSRDTFHGFHILGTDINVQIPARGKGKVVVVFEPSEEGVYEFVCSVRCGAGHTEMRGKIVVKESALQE